MLCIIEKSIADQREIRCESGATAITVLRVADMLLYLIDRKIACLLILSARLLAYFRCFTLLGKEKYQEFHFGDVEVSFCCVLLFRSKAFFLYRSFCSISLHKESAMKMTKEDCIYILKEKYMMLDRYPHKSDFSEEEVAMIKSYLGPWPRALEAAGIK